MTIPQQRELKGFDSYELRLGDELRGERACLGKSLFDVQRDLRIKACYIDAIENSDPVAIENKSFVAGYIRSYARYLKLDPEEVYRRFCEESGFQPARARMAAQTQKPSANRGLSASDDPFGASDLASVLDRRPGFDFGPLISASASIIAVAALVGGIGYGGWTFLKNVQQVASAPAEATAVAAVSLSAISRRPSEIATIDPSVYEDDGVLAQLYRNEEAAPLGFSSADGPIAAIDPNTAGVFARSGAPTASAVLAKSLAPVALRTGGDGLPAAPAPTESGAQAAAIPLAFANATPLDATPSNDLVPVAGVAKGVEIRAIEEAWVRVEAPGVGVLFSGLMSPGESYDLPSAQVDAILKVGNAGGVLIFVDGEAFGPMGRKGVVQSGIALHPDQIRTSYPRAPGASFQRAASQTGSLEHTATDQRG